MPDINTLIEKDKIRETIDSMYVATDKKDWKKIEDLFDDRVQFDMSSLTGKPASVETGRDIAKTWEIGLKDVPIIHHQSGNFFITVDKDHAHVFNYGMATHHFPEGSKVKTRWFVGSYNWDLAKKSGNWKITSIRFNKKYVEEQ